MRRFSYDTAEKIMWAGAIILLIACWVVGWNWGFLAELPLVAVLAFWGFFVRRFLSQS